MSTNYYWIFENPGAVEVMLPTGELIISHGIQFDFHSFHIGKRYGCGDAETAFIWAIEPMIALTCIEKKCLYCPGEKIVQDEYGRQFTAPEFSILLHDNCRWELKSIGENFC